MSVRRSWRVAGLSMVALAVASAVDAQSPTDHGVWTLVAHSAPDYSVQLPEGWSSDATSQDIRATTSTGDTLAVTVATMPPGQDFDAYVTGVEAGLEQAAGTGLPTTFRQLPTGVVARIDQPGTGSVDTSAQFLFTPCPDGVRTLTITGAAPAASDTGRPDAWDEIAAGIDPCTTTAAPPMVIDPVIQALADQYFTLARDSNARIGTAYAPLAQGSTIKVWKQRARRIAELQQQFVDDVDTMAWTPEVRPLVDTLLVGYRDSVQLWAEGFAKATKANDITSRYGDLTRISDATRAAGQALRLAIGLPSNPR
jgi:hypothetical protein